MEKEIDMYQIKENIETAAKTLWQGRGMNMELVQGSIFMAANLILNQVGNGFGRDIDFPVQYVSEAIEHYNEALKRKDDYLMADCLYYEWREIITVYLEVIEELEKNA